MSTKKQHKNNTYEEEKTATLHTRIQPSLKADAEEAARKSKPKLSLSQWIEMAVREKLDKGK